MRGWRAGLWLGLCAAAWPAGVARADDADADAPAVRLRVGGGAEGVAYGYFIPTSGRGRVDEMQWEDALEAVTIAPAEAFGLGQEMGSLAPGKAADLVLWSGDPFEFSTGAELVLIRGQEVPLTSRMTELRERYRTLPPRY